MRSLIIIFTCIIPYICFAQIENVPLGYPVYDFIKEMSVKKIISGYDEDNPNLSRFEVADFLKVIDSKKSELSNTEIRLLNKYKVEYIPEEANEKNTWKMFGSGKNFLRNLEDFFSNKQKYIFYIGKPGNNAYIEGLGHIYAGNEIKPSKNNSALLMDGGFRGRGTILNHLGYYLDYYKGATFGNKNLQAKIEPRLRADFKFNEDKEKVRNYDFTSAYVKYFIEPMEDFKISAQLGREKLTYGYGYGSKLILSGDNPNLDFLKINFSYGPIKISEIFASTAGRFLPSRNDRYTKYYSAHKLKVCIKDLFDIGYTDMVVYNGRIDFAYLNPLMLWHFAEKSLQDRDNKILAIDLQTKFMKNIEFQGTVYIDDDEGFALLTGKTDISEKIAYQVGTYIYEPFSIKNLSLIFEYTKIRPYTYTHDDPRNDYTAYGLNLGHRIGPNADEIYTKLSYNIYEWGRLNLEFSRIRKGNNVYDNCGNLVRNTGGDISQPFRYGTDDPEARFLDGERVNTNMVTLNFRFIPVRNYIFDFYYIYQIDNNLSKGFKNDFSYGFVRLNIDY